MLLNTTVTISGQRWTALFAVIIQILLFTGLQTRASAAGNQVFHGTVPGAVARLTPIKRLLATNHLDLVIALPLRHQDLLTNLLQDIYNPASPNYHHYLTPAQFAEQFGPTTNDYQAAAAFMASNGLRVTCLHPNHTLLDVNGTVADIEKLFHVNMRVYSHPTEARTFYAPDVEPSLNFSVPLLAVHGLDNFVVPRPMNINTNFFNQPTNTIAFTTTGSGPRGNFIGRDFRAAYAPGVTLDGSGQAVGLFELDSYYPSDIATYENLAGLPNVPLTNVFVDGFNIGPGGNNVEVALDIDMAISMAPGLSKVIVYQGFSPNDVLNRMATDDQAAQLSCSWGFGNQVDPVREQIFQQFAAQGQSFFQASGDTGAGTIYPPSDDPFVTSVGGTSLTTSMLGGAWTSETVWSGSTGGISASYTIPVWQQGLSMSANHGSSMRRNIPDVACVADDIIWLVANNGDQGVTGGTSAAAPLWAGFAALVNQQAAANGKSNAGFMNPAIYAIGQSSNYAAAFHDISVGNNTNSSSPTNFYAVAGYDLCTGWGTPAGTALINALLGPPNALQITPAVPLVFTGPVGGPFTPSQQGIALTNASEVSLNWALGNSALWLEALTTNGTLTPGGPAANVVLPPSPYASSLPAGSYSTTVLFTNLNDGSTQNRQLILNVAPSTVPLPGVDVTTLYSFTGGTDGESPNGLLQATNGILYGTAQHGGNYFAGTVFQLTTNGTFGVLYSFTGGNDGATPFAALAQGPDGTLYGTSFQGGAGTNGTAFKTTLAGSFTPLVSFNVTNGDLPFAGMTLGADSNFYGTTYQGGASGRGTVFRMTTNGTLTTLYSFSGGNDGSQPAAGLVQGIDGSFYGTTYKGGTNSCGTVFKITSNGLFTLVTSFDNTNGAFSSAGLVQDAGGNFYGTTTRGGTYGNGAFFKITPAGLLSNLYSFTGSNDGQTPHALTLGADGNFYGTTAFGGTYGYGTAFVISPDGVLNTLLEFNGFAGANPQSTLTQGADGYLYGTTQNGGAAGHGTVFRLGITSVPQITSQPASQTVFMGATVRFSVSVLGSSPLSYQWQKNGTNLADAGIISGSGSRVLTLSGVGANEVGSYSVIVSNNLGSVVSGGASLAIASAPPVIVTQPTNQTLSPGGTATFSVSVLGNVPLVYQWQKNGTNLTDGGPFSGSTTSTLRVSVATEANNGTYALVVTNALGYATSSNATLTVVPVSAAGTALSSVHWFNNGTGGGWLPNGLLCSSNGILYGTTQSGSASTNSGSGTIFEMTTNGQFATLVSFSGSGGGAPGSTPMAALIQDANGNLYGTTEYGGSNNLGTVFELASDNTFTNLYAFTGASDGADPTASLTLGTDGNLYGVAGGSSGAGNIFKITANGAFSNLYSFTGGMDGKSPAGALLQGSDGNFYGLTSFGGSPTNGVVFKMTPGGTLTNLHSFIGTDGFQPVGALVQGTDGNLYGATKYNTIGRFLFYGTFFKVTPGGKLTTLYALNSPDGAYPNAGLIQGSDGNFYGTTLTGAYSTNGTVFRLTPSGTLTTLVAFDNFNDGAHPASALVEASPGIFYGTTTSGGIGGGGTIFRLTITSTPQITSQPINQTAFAGATVAFIVADFGAAPLYYQWLKNGVALTDGGHVSGSSSRVLQLNNVSLADQGNYCLVVSNSLGSVTSSSASLTVIPPPMFKAFTLTNGTATLRWSAMSGQKYQLQYNSDPGSTNWINLGSAITATNGLLSATNSVGSDSKRFYRVILTP